MDNILIQSFSTRLPSLETNFFVSLFYLMAPFSQRIVFVNGEESILKKSKMKMKMINPQRRLSLVKKFTFFFILG